MHKIGHLQPKWHELFYSSLEKNFQLFVLHYFSVLTREANGLGKSVFPRIFKFLNWELLFFLLSGWRNEISEELFFNYFVIVSFNNDFYSSREIHGW